MGIQKQKVQYQAEGQRIRTQGILLCLRETIRVLQLRTKDNRQDLTKISIPEPL